MKPHDADPQAALDRVEHEFVELWGTMSSLWGINPTMARIHGLLFITGAEMTMDAIMERLGISRGNVSMNLTKLMEWGLVKRVHKRGDRRDHYESLADVWEMVTLIAAQRKRREIDPILGTLRRVRDDLAPRVAAGGEPIQERFQRVDELLKFLEVVDGLASQFFESHKSLKAAVELLANAEE